MHIYIVKNGTKTGPYSEEQVLAAGWRRDYNEARPHSSLEYLAPAVFAPRWRALVGATPLPAHASAETLKP